MSEQELNEAMGRAIAHHTAGRLTDAEVLYRHVLLMQPNNANALNFLGVIAAQTGHPDAGIDLIRRAIQSQPNFAGAFNNLGNVLRDSGRGEQAIAAYLRAIQIDPKLPDPHNNLGAVLYTQGRLDEAIAAYSRALALHADYAEARFNLGGAWKAKGRLEDALACFQMAIRIQPDHSQSHLILAHTLLLTGDFSRGWAEYEWRWKVPAAARPRAVSKPHWNGEALEGRTILLHAEQGIGDTIQFARYAPMVAARGGRVVLECAPDSRLLEKMEGIAAVVPAGRPLPDFDLHCPLLTLPMIFGTDLNSIPSPGKYLSADAPAVEDFKSRLGPREEKLRVGLVWAGRPEFQYDRIRSIPLTKFAPLAGVKYVEFHALQKGSAADQTPPEGLALRHWNPALHDFADTAALVENLDLVVTVDTAVAHLAGAMGKETWLLLPFMPDWRWMLNRSDSPWYPTMRLFRQRVSGDWDDVLTRLAAEFAARIGAKST